MGDPMTDTETRGSLKGVIRRGPRQGFGAAPFAHGGEVSALSRYFEDLGRHGVLDMEEEAAAAARIADLEQILQRARRHGERSRRCDELEIELQRAKDDFIRANLRLVVAIARRYDKGRMSLEDIIQEGNLGLIKAVDRFDHRLGFRFSTYASWWIRHSIGRALADKGHAVRVPVHALDDQRRLAKTTEAMWRRLGRPPTDDELSEEIGIDARKVARVRRNRVLPACSLDRELGDGDERRWVDLIPDDRSPSPFERAALSAWSEGMDGVLEILEPMERAIIRWRFGLDGGGEELTLKEIGERFGLSRERIRQLQERALRKIRSHLDLDAA